MDSTSKTKITLAIIYGQQEFSHSIESGSDFTLLDRLNELGVAIDQSCGGYGTCGTCKITVIKNIQNLSFRSEIEKEMSEDRGFTETERLCCQSYLLGPVKIKIL